MESLKIRFLFLLSCLVLCVGCSTKQVKGEPPFIGISSMIVQENTLATKFDIRNINDVKLDIDAIDIKIWVRSVELTHYINEFKLTLDPNTTEEVSLEDSPGAGSRQLLDELERGEVASLPFSLEGRIHTQSDGYLSFKNEGHLYPVPGKPGQFRSASSRTP